MCTHDDDDASGVAYVDRRADSDITGVHLITPEASLSAPSFDNAESAWLESRVALWSLSARQREVFILTLAGVTHREDLAARLALSTETVKAHVRGLLARSNFESLAELALATHLELRTVRDAAKSGASTSDVEAQLRSERHGVRRAK